MTKLIFVMMVLWLMTSGTALASSYEHRCGWYENPTPSNSWLIDRDGTWIIGAMGGRQAEDDMPWTHFKQTKNNWVMTNGKHGYGCACLTVRTDHSKHQIEEIKEGEVKSLAVCRQDPDVNVKEPKH